MPDSLIVLDTETATAHGPPHLIELGALRVVEGDIVDRFESLVCPQVAIDPFVSRIHGIEDEHVRNAPEAAEVLARFAEWAGDGVFAAHNARFDAGVLAFESVRTGVELPGQRFVDSLKLARRWLPEASDHKLETLCQHLELDIEVHHRALADAVACWMVIEECIERSAAERKAADPSTAMAAAASEPSWIAELTSWCGSFTIPGLRPRVTKLAPRLRALERACVERGEIVLVYGEDQAPARLHVRPILMYQRETKGYLEAECLRSGTLKTYRLDRVQKVLSNA
jgi:DNA polymerase III epsilon subunit family exonuclease